MSDEDYSFEQVNSDGTIKQDGPLFAPVKRHEGWPERISVSLIKDYQSCPAKAYARITKQPQKKSYSLVTGIATHQGLEDWVKHQRDPIAVYDAKFKEEVRRNDLPVRSPEATKAYDVGKFCVNAGVEVLSKNGFNKKLDPKLAESFFSFERNGRLYVGKIDLMVNDEDGLRIIDYKTGRTAPSVIELKTDLQFSTYYFGALLDENLPTHGIWAKTGVYLHLRGKDVGTKTKPQRQYSFPLTRTPEQVESAFANEIEPIVERMEAGDYYRIKGSQCGWCQYANADGECLVDLPTREAYHKRQAQSAINDKGDDTKASGV